MSYPGYPAGGYPGYPSQPGQPAYGAPGYPPTSGYPAAPGAAPGYPQAPGYPPGTIPGYPAAGGYPQAGGYPAATGAYPPAPGPYPQVPPQAAPGFTSPYGQPPAAGPYPQQPPGYGQPPAPGYGQPPAGYGPTSQPSYPAVPGQAQMYGQPGAQPHGAPPPTGAPQQATRPQAPPVSQPPVAAMRNLAMTDQAFETHGTVKPASPFDAEADAEALRKAMKGIGTDEKAIIDLIARRSNEQRQKIKQMFKTMYGKDLIKDLKSELSGNFEECILGLFIHKAFYDAHQIHKAIEGLGTNEAVLIEILCTRPNSEIRDISAEYKKNYGSTMEAHCVGDTSGTFKRLLVSMCQGNRDENTAVDTAKAQKDANDLFQAGEKKLGTDESMFNKILAVRSFAQLRATFDAYTRIAHRDISSSIEREFSGNIKDGLLAIVQCVRNRPEYFADKLNKSMAGAGTKDDTLIRVVITRSEIDLVEIKKAYLERHRKTLTKAIEGDTSGDYKRMLLALVGPEF